MIKIILISIITSLILFSCNTKHSSINLDTVKIIDLTHPFDKETIYWPTAESFKFDTVFAGITDKGFYYTAFRFCSAEHGGTHLDAPIHFAKDKQTVDKIPLTNLIGKAIVIDIKEKALENKDYLIGIDDFKNWEDKNGKIFDGAIVLLNTGYARFWPDREKYMGTAELGQNAVAKLHFPGLDPKAAEWLTNKRKINAIGLDTPGIDYGQSVLFKSHQRLLKNNIPVFENVTNLDKLPSQGAFVFALPMKIKGGSGGPLRIVALVNSD